MAFAYTKYENLTGSQTDFAIGFTYLDTDEIVVKLDGVETSDYSVIGGGSTIRFTTGPTALVMEITRVTDVTSALVDFNDDTGLLSDDLDNQNQQLLQAVQEARDLADRSILREDTLDFQGVRGENVGDPVDDTDAANKQYVDGQVAGVASDVAAAEAARDAAQAAQTGAEAAQTAAETARDETVASQELVDEKILGAYADDAAAEASVSGSVTVGAYYWNTTDNVVRVWDGSAWNEIASGGGEITAPVVATDTSDGVKTNFILPFEPSAKAFILFIVNGIAWKQSEFSFAGTTLTTTSAPAAGDVEIIIMEVTGLTEVAAGTIGAAQIDPSEVNAIKALLGVPTRAIGEFFWHTGSTPPAYALALDGQTQSRSGAYADLWAFAQTSGNVAASEGAKQAGQFGPGDGSTTFTLPNLMQLDGLFVRAYDASTGRVFGDYQADAFQGHRHGTYPGSSSYWVEGNGSTLGGSGYNFMGATGTGDPVTDGTNGTPRTADETRSKNVALLPCIVATSGIVSDVPLINAGQTVANVGELQAQVASLFEFQRAVQNTVSSQVTTGSTYTAPARGEALGAELTPLTTTINNIAAGNKVKINLSIFGEGGHNIMFQLTRNGQKILAGTGGIYPGVNGLFCYTYDSSGNINSTPENVSGTFVDETPDTGTNIYRVHVQTGSTAAEQFHLSVSALSPNANENGVSSMVLQEIPAYTDYNALAAARAASPTMLDALTQRVDAIEPGALQTVSNVSEIVIDLTPYKNVDGLCDIDVVLSDLEPTVSGSSVYAQVSTDGGVSYLSSSYRYVAAYETEDATSGVSGLSSNTHMYLHGNTGTDPLEKAHNRANITITSSAIICHATSAIAISDGRLRVWHSNSRHASPTADTIRFYFSSGNIAAGTYYIRNNLRAS